MQKGHMNVTHSPYLYYIFLSIECDKCFNYVQCVLVQR